MVNADGRLQNNVNKKTAGIQSIENASIGIGAGSSVCSAPHFTADFPLPIPFLHPQFTILHRYTNELLQ
ncbi:hypothetical protein CS954_06300 [Bacillus siamensis]|nr:hypothetical protein CS954_06300 [Bacillus siamensis]